MTLGSRQIEVETRPIHFDVTARILLLLVVVTFVATRLWRLTASCLWFDEIFSVHAARHSWPTLAKFTAADIIHPPLFYALLKIWIAIGGESLFWLRLLPLAIAVATILPFWLLCRELKLKPAETNFALLLMAVSGFLIKYAQEVRMYSLLLFFSVFSIWLFVRFLRAETSSKKELIILTAINLLLVYTHYYGWLVIVVQLIVLILSRKKLALFSLSAGALVLAYVPWIYEIAATERGKGLAQNLGWIARPGSRDIGEYFVGFGKPLVFAQSNNERVDDTLSVFLVLILFGVSLLIFTWNFLKARSPERDFNREIYVWVGLFSFAPVILAFVLSWILPYPIWGTRHLIIAAAPLSILVAVATLRLRPHWIKITVLIVLGCWVLLAGTISIMVPARAYTWCAWDGLARQIPPPDSRLMPTEIYAFEDLVAYHLWFATSKTYPDRFKVTVIKGVMPEDPAFFLPRRFDDIKTADQSQISGEHFWLAFRAPRWDETHPPLSIVEAKGYQAGTVLTTKAQGEQSFLVELSLRQSER